MKVRKSRGRKSAGSESPVGLAHDYLLVMRGAERTFAAITDCWPEAPVYTTLYSRVGTAGRFSGRRIRSTYLQHLRVGQRTFRALLPLYPRAIERLPVSGHDLLVSSSSAFAHGLTRHPDAVHVCYCHTPFRYAWHERDAALSEVARPLRPLVKRSLDRIRDWDVQASRRVTRYLANSETVRQRIADCYGREAQVVHPPVEVERFTPGEPEDYFLVVSELARHKRIQVALEAAKMARVPIKVVGDGPELSRLRSRYGYAAEFLGRCSDTQVATLYAGALALIVPGVEEFGIAAVEAQAAGRPVVALDAGGARETVLPGETGVLVSGGSKEFADVLRSVNFVSFDTAMARRNAERFSRQVFQQKLVTAVASAVGQS